MFEKTESLPSLVSIITVNFNQPELTCALLESIRQQEYQKVQVIVVDNASTIDPAAVFLEHYPEVTFIRSTKNLGFAGGNNLALPHAKGEYLFYVNNDAEITPGCIEKLVSFLQTHPQTGIVSPLICYSANRQSPTTIQYAGMPRVNPFTGRSNMDGNGAQNRGQYAAPFPTGYAHGAAMMVPRNVVDAIGPMREDYFLYYEEVDWCERMHKAGYGVWVEPRALVWHKESMTMARLGSAKTYYLIRNRILLMRRHYGGWPFGVFAIFLIFVTVPKHLFRMRDKGAFLRGVLAGLSGHGVPTAQR